jgi:hypothetical protein
MSVPTGLGACRSMPIARSKPPVPPNTSLLFGHNATALLPHRASYRRNIRLRIGQRAYSDRLLGKYDEADVVFVGITGRSDPIGIADEACGQVTSFSNRGVTLMPSRWDWIREALRAVALGDLSPSNRLSQKARRRGGGVVSVRHGPDLGS